MGDVAAEHRPLGSPRRAAYPQAQQQASAPNQNASHAPTYASAYKQPLHPIYPQASQQSRTHSQSKRDKLDPLGTDALATSHVGKYTLYDTIGEGAFGKVKVAANRETKEVYAVKIMDKSEIREQEFTSQVRREIYIMRRLKHKNIVRMHEVLTSDTKLYIVMELVKGGELFHHLEKHGRVNEAQARKYFQQLVDGVDFCHKSGVAHRDLKPENILLDENGDIKITDFGFSSMKGVDVNAGLLYTQCGTPDYCAPEIIESACEGYNGAKVDAWSCGVVLYALLVGRLPFQEEDTEKLYGMVVACRVEYPTCIPPLAKDLLQHLLVRDPEQRYDLQQVKRHPWFLLDYEGDDARLLKKRPFFNRNNQRAPINSSPSSPVATPAETPTPAAATRPLPLETPAQSVSEQGSSHQAPSTPRTPVVNDTVKSSPVESVRLSGLSSRPVTEYQATQSMARTEGAKSTQDSSQAYSSASEHGTTGRVAALIRMREEGNEPPPRSVDADAHMRAPTPPIHAVFTRVEDRPATPATSKPASLAARAQRVSNGILADGTTLPSNIANAANRAPSPMPLTLQARKGDVTTRNTGGSVASASSSQQGKVSEAATEEKSEAPSDTTGVGYDDDSSSDGDDSIEDYQDKPVPQLELPIEPLSRVRAAKEQRMKQPSQNHHQLSLSHANSRQSDPHHQLPAQRHRSDVSSSSAIQALKPIDPTNGSASLSSLQQYRRGLTPAPSNGTRDPRGLRSLRNSEAKPNSPTVGGPTEPILAPFHRFQPPSPGVGSRQTANGPSPDFSTGGFGNGRMHPEPNSARHMPWHPTVSDSILSAAKSHPSLLQTELCARHLWSIVAKWRGTHEPMSPTSSLDIRSDFRVLISEISSFSRPEEKGAILDRFLSLFEAYGLGDLPVSVGQTHSAAYSANGTATVPRQQRLHSDLDEEYEEVPALNGREDIGQSAGEARNHSNRRHLTDISSEEEPLSWSPMHDDSQRHQSDLARRREMSDLLNKWITKTQMANARDGRTDSPHAVSEEENPSMDIGELQRLMRQHQTGREESNLADELLKLMQEPSDLSSHNGLTGATSTSGQSPPAPTAQASLSSDNHVPAGRWPTAPHPALNLSRGTRPGSNNSHGRLPFDYSSRYDISQSSLPVMENYSLGEKSSASVGNSSDNGYGGNSQQPPHLRERRGIMATSMGMHDVEYYGPDRKNGMAMKLRGVLHTMKARNQKLAEGLTQFRSTLPCADIVRMLCRILQDLGAVVTLKRETKRKLKCKLRLQDDHFLYAAVDLVPADNGATSVMFKRSRADRGKTDIASFHEFYERVRELFIAEVQARYDRGSSSGLPKRKRSPRHLGNSFGHSSGS